MSVIVNVPVIVTVPRARSPVFDAHHVPGQGTSRRLWVSPQPCWPGRAPISAHGRKRV